MVVACPLAPLPVDFLVDSNVVAGRRTQMETREARERGSPFSRDLLLWEPKSPEVTPGREGVGKKTRGDTVHAEAGW